MEKEMYVLQEKIDNHQLKLINILKQIKQEKKFKKVKSI